MSPNVLQKFFDGGQLIAAADHGVRPSDLATIKSASDRLSGGDADYSRKIASLAADVMLAGGGEGSAEHSLFVALSKEAAWTETHQMPVDCFLSSLFYADAGYAKKASGEGKGGAGPLDLAYSALNIGKKGYGDLLRSALGLGLIGGAATGAVHHVLDQDIAPAKEEAPPLDAAIEAKMRERDYYRRVRAETVARLRRSKTKFKPSEVASAASYA